jgi:hypothetical protein
MLQNNRNVMRNFTATVAAAAGLVLILFHQKTILHNFSQTNWLMKKFYTLDTRMFLFLIPAFFCTYAGAQMSGTYTINAGSPASATNFQSFNAAATALSAQGVNGHVIINVVANSGPYTEQVVFTGITGTGPAATITLNGSNDTLKAVTNTTDRHALRLSGLSYFTLNDLNIVAKDAISTTNFYGVHVFGNCSNITINNIRVDMTGITTTLTGGIVVSGNLTSILTAGNSNNITISNNTTTGGGYGLSFMGTANTGLLMNNNTIYDFSSNGIYTRGTNGAVIRDNVLNKRAGAAGANAIQLAQSDNANASVYNNIISHWQTASATFRGIYVFGGTGHKVYNNLVHDIRTETGTNVIGIAVRAGAPEVSFNTVRFDHAQSSAVPMSAFTEELSNTGTLLRNNIFYITQPSTAARTGISMGTTTTINAAVNSNRNVFWLPGGNLAMRGTAIYNTLANWQAAGTQDPNSLYADPEFASGSSIPTNLAIDNIATPITGITTDITGAARSSTPDPGAYEFSSSACNGAVGGTAQSSASQVCSPGSVTLTATSYSFGAGSSYQWESSSDNFVANVNDLAGQVNPATITVANISATTYYRLKVNCASGTATAYSNIITITAQQPVTIVTQPAAQAVCAGSNVSFTVSANNASVYQWQKNGVDITGANSATLTINNANATHAGSYRVIINGTAPCAPVTSALAALSINEPVVITLPLQNQFACEGTAASFTVSTTGTVLSYQWQKGTAPISGATSASYSISQVTAADAGSYSVVITGACNTVTSTSANLVVGNNNSWIGQTSTNWNTASNWCGGVPTSTNNVLIPTGTNFSPVVTGTANAGSVTINTGASLSVPNGARLNIHGNYANNGTMNAQGTIAFQGSSSQAVSTLTANEIIMNGAGGIVLGGNMSAVNLTLTNGNITLGTHSFSLGNGTSGSEASHIITNGTGSVIASAVGTTAFAIPIAHDASGYNPVTITNGGTLNYTVRVAQGLTPAIANSARAINRTWNITPSSAPGSPVNISLQYADAHANASSTPAGIMEVGVNNGTLWSIVSPSAGITPTGTATGRVVSYSTTTFGPTVITNPGGISYPTSLPVDPASLLSVELLPNLVSTSAILKLNTGQHQPLKLVITDAMGRTVKEMNWTVLPGQNLLPLELTSLAGGVYQLGIISGNKKPAVLRFIKK